MSESSGKKCNANCANPTLGMTYKVLDGGIYYHIDCFKCTICGCKLSDDTYLLDNNSLRCKQCEKDLQTPINGNKIEIPPSPYKPSTSEIDSTCGSLLVDSRNRNTQDNGTMVSVSVSMYAMMQDLQCITFIAPLKSSVVDAKGENHNLGAYCLWLDYMDKNKRILQVRVQSAELKRTLEKNIFATISIFTKTKRTSKKYNQHSPGFDESFQFIRSEKDDKTLELRDYRYSFKIFGVITGLELIGCIKIKLDEARLDRIARWYYIQRV